MGTQRIIDADGHIREAEQVMLEYFEPPHRPLSLRALFPSDGWGRHLPGRLLTEVPDAAAWLKGLELGGMETAVLFPTLGLFHREFNAYHPGAVDTPCKRFSITTLAV
jgi:hypothetical protein